MDARSAGGDAAGVDAGAEAEGCAGLSVPAADRDLTLEHGGLTRHYHVHVPASYEPARRTALVFDFHGYSSNGTQERWLSGMIAKAEAAGFIVVHPEGTGAVQSWNGGTCCGDASAGAVDDVGFVRAMIDSLASELCVDPARVFATGMSNGGFLSHRLACELSDRIAAVAPVAGGLVLPTCAPPRPVPVLHFHGTADAVVPYEGSATNGFPDVQEMIQGWARRDGCGATPVESYQQGEVTCLSWPGCAGGTEVILCTVEGGGHTWPGGMPVPSLGHTTTDISATDEAWAFFERHPRP